MLARNFFAAAIVVFIVCINFRERHEVHMDRHPISRAGYDKKKQEIADLEVKLGETAEMIKLAREEGDLSENAEYHGQRETHGMLQAKINLLKSQLASCYIADASAFPKGQVNFGSTVTVKDLDDGMEEEYTLVGPGEEDYDVEPMKILTNSPIGQGLIGKKVGDTAEIAIPAGTMKVEITEIIDPE